jgi:predicted amidohydrolase YtcJ
VAGGASRFGPGLIPSLYLVRLKSVKNIHCIGDRAHSVVLDIFEGILGANAGAVNLIGWRPRIEHSQIMTGEDLERIGRLGGKFFDFSINPTWALTLVSVSS